MYINIYLLVGTFGLLTSPWAQALQSHDQKQKPATVLKYISLVDGSKIVNTERDYQFMSLDRFGAPALLMHDVHTGSIHYFMTEARTDLGGANQARQFCEGVWVTREVCQIRGLSNTLVLTSISKHSNLAKPSDPIFVHTLMVAKKSQDNKKEVQKLAKFMSEIK